MSALWPKIPWLGLARLAGFEPATIWLTAERTTAVLLTLKKNPQHGGLFGVNYLQALYSIIRSIQDSFMQSQH